DYYCLIWHNSGWVF
nr:immunoglobulin light chain junction region [Macaca mulatta]MOY07398.1 immunoglobulin light chain junction region [Macaca mulatta]